MVDLREQEMISDKRLLRGTRTREAVLRYAVDLASLEGLDNVSFGRLASDSGLSKSGVQALFRSKEVLQLATIHQARQMFIGAVIRPAQSSPPGVERFWALLAGWRSYAVTPLFAGGCFRVANLAQFDSRPGPIRDELIQDQRLWRDAIAGELRNAAVAGEIAELDVTLAALEVDALLCSANTALRLGDDDAVDNVFRIIEGMLRPRDEMGTRQ
jgi:AcrR family transcriptional regulator